jgi:hypothetical protein
LRLVHVITLKCQIPGKHFPGQPKELLQINFQNH